MSSIKHKLRTRVTSPSTSQPRRSSLPAGSTKVQHSMSSGVAIRRRRKSDMELSDEESSPSKSVLRQKLAPPVRKRGRPPKTKPVGAAEAVRDLPKKRGRPALKRNDGNKTEDESDETRSATRSATRCSSASGSDLCMLTPPYSETHSEGADSVATIPEGIERTFGVTVGDIVVKKPYRAPQRVLRTRASTDDCGQSNDWRLTPAAEDEPDATVAKTKKTKAVELEKKIKKRIARPFVDTDDTVIPPAQRVKPESTGTDVQPLVLTGRIKESHGREIYSVASNPFLPPAHSAQFATVGSDSIQLYECPADRHGAIVLLASFCDSTEQRVKAKGAKKGPQEKPITIRESFYAVTFCYEDRGGDDQESYVVAAGLRGVIRVISLRTQNSSTLYGHGGVVNDLRTHPRTPTFVISASKDMTARIWTIKSPVCLAVIGGYKAHNDQVLSADWFMAGKFVITGSMDHTLRVWAIPDELKTRMAEWADPATPWCVDLPPRRAYFASNPNITGVNCQQHHTKSEPTRKLGKRHPLHHLEAILIFASVANTQEIHSNYVDCVRAFAFTPFVLSKSAQNIIQVTKFGDPDFDLDNLIGKEGIPEKTISTLRTLYLEKCDSWFVKFGISEDRRWMACGTTDGHVGVFDLKNILNSDEATYKVPMLSRGLVRQCAFSQCSDILLAVTDESMVVRMDRAEPGERNPPYLIHMNPNPAKKGGKRSRGGGKRKRAGRPSQQPPAAAVPEPSASG